MTDAQSSLVAEVRGVRPVTLLHVDDDPNDAELLRAAIHRARLPVVLAWAEGGDEALAYLSGRKVAENGETAAIPALVLLDFKMPRVNGLEVLQRIRRLPQPDLQSIPVVVLSGSHLQDDICQAYEAGANSYLIKPLAFDALVSLVKGIYSIWLARA